MRVVLQAASERASAEARCESIPAGKTVPSGGAEQHKGHDTIRPSGGKSAGDERAKGAADEQRARDAQRIEQCGKRIRVVGRGRRIRGQPIGRTIARRIPRHDAKARSQRIELLHPGTGLVADAVQKTYRWPLTRLAI